MPFALVLFACVLAGAARADEWGLADSRVRDGLPTKQDEGGTALSVPAAGLSWVIERVDTPKWFLDMGPRSLALDTGGYPHVAYGGDFLYYAWFDGTTWHHETVDDSGLVGRYTSLALDSEGYAYISYFDARGAIKLARQLAAGWYTETVDAGTVDYNSLALDSGGHPHISYHRGGVVMYTFFDGTAWVTEPVDVNVSGENALALDSSDHPHVAYHGEGVEPELEGELRYAWHDGSTWHVEVVDSGGADTGAHESIALDSSDHPHIGYYFEDWPDHAVKYAHRDTQGWRIQTVDSVWAPGCYTSLALDTGDLPHISYFDFDRSDGDLAYASYDGEAWITETVESEGNVGLYTSLALDAAGRPHISYLYNDPLRDAALRLAVHNGAEWQIETVDRAGHVGWFNSLALDTSGAGHVGYCKAGNAEDVYPQPNGCVGLKYAHLTGTGWQTEAVDDNGFAGWYTSLALDADDHPHISYGAVSTETVWCDTLRYAHHDGTTWLTETVETGGGLYSSLAVDPAGQPHIAYVGGYPGYELRYASQEGTSWRLETVDSVHAGGVSLAFGSAGLPHIGYYALTRHGPDSLRYAHFDGTRWMTETVEDGIDPHPGTGSLAVDLMDRPAIVYGDSANLNYAYRDEAGWHIETVDHRGGAGISLAFDAAGRPHITYSYRDGIEIGVAYARFDGANWVIETVDSGYEWHWGDMHVGIHTSLALDAAGRAHISYYDGRNGDLMLAYQCTGLTGARVRGPLALLPGRVGTYRASPIPAGASEPVLFGWDNGTVGPQASYSWTLTGTYTLTVTATNACGEARGSLQVEIIESWPYHFYLPVVLRGS